MSAANNIPPQWARIRKAAQPLLVILAILLAGVILVFLIVRYGYAAPWTGFDGQEPKRLWDWLDLLVIPVFILIAGFIYGEWQRRTQYRLEKDRQNSDALQAYFDSMKDLIIDGDLGETLGDEDDPLRALARSKTITTLQMIDDERKKAVFNFLSHAGLIVLNQPLILLDELELTGANLRGIKLTFVDLRSIGLNSADLSRAEINNCNFALAGLAQARGTRCKFSDTALDNAILEGASFPDATFYAVRLVGAHMSKSRFKNAVMSRSFFNGADLRDADFSGAQLDYCDFANIDETEEGRTRIRNTRLAGTHLQGARFTGVDFSQGVDFREAVLDRADFRGSNITARQLEPAKSKRGMILPDGNTVPEG